MIMTTQNIPRVTSQRAQSMRRKNRNCFLKRQEEGGNEKKSRQQQRRSVSLVEFPVHGSNPLDPGRKKI
jgi:hypothetical protein